MKKFLTLFAFLAVLVAPLSTRAQMELTVADGTGTTSYAPFYSLYADWGTESEFIYPATLLGEMTSSNIVSLTFYSSTSSIVWDETISVYIEEVDASSHSGSSSLKSDGATLVWSGSPVLEGGLWTIELDEPFAYSGGNLLVYVSDPGLDDGECTSLSWTAISSTGAGLYRTATSSHDMSSSWTIDDYLPKCTFGYTAGSGNICRKPSGLVLDTLATTSTSLTFNWTAPEGVSQFIYTYGNNNPWTLTSETTATIEDLTPGTQYTFKVCSLCGNTDTSSAASARAYTSCVPLTQLPFEVDFSTWSTGAITDPCWNSSSSIYSSALDLEAFSSSWSSSGSAYVILPAIDESIALNTLELVVNAKSYYDDDDYYYDYSDVLQIGVTNSDVITSANTDIIATINVGHNDFSSYVVSLANYQGDKHRLVLLAPEPEEGGYYGSYNEILIRSLDLHLAPSCQFPQGVAVSGTTAESVTLTIADTNDVNSYHIIITRDTVTVYNDVVDSKVFTLEEGLTANTAYNVSVAAVCPDGNETAKVYTSFRTECALMTLPYTENFESVASYSFPECWTLLKNYTSYGTTYPYVSSTTDAPDGAKAIYMYTNASSDTNMFRTSVIPLEPNQIHISFWSSCRNLKVGLMTESNDPSSFVPLMTTNSDSWTEYDIFTDTLDLEAENVYLAFLLTGGNRYGYVDGILIEQSSDCRRPVSGRLVSKSYNNAVVGINADEESTADSYVVRYNTAFDNSDTAATAVTVTCNEDNEATLNDLTPNTSYNVWTRGICGDQPTTWRYLGYFTTDLSCYPVSNLTVDNTNFTSAHISWQYAGDGRGIEESGVRLTLRDTAVIRSWTMTAEEGNGTFITNLEPGTSYTLEVRTLCDPDSASSQQISFSTTRCGEVGNASSTSEYLPLHGNYKWSYTQTLYPLSAVASMQAINGIQYNVNSVPSSYKKRPVQVWIGQTALTELTTTSYVDTADMVKVFADSMDVSQTGWTTLQFSTPFTVNPTAGDIVVAVLNTTGQYSSFYFKATTGTGKAVYGYQDGTQPSTYTTISSYSNKSTTTKVADIRFMGECNMDCTAPNLALGNVDINSVNLEWVAAGDETEWVVAHRADSVNTWTFAEQNATSTSTTVNGLSGRTRYHFRVGNICGNDTVWSNTVNCYTLCEPLTTLPFTEGFEGIPSGTDPLCWQVNSISTSGSHSVSTSSPHNGQQCMYFYPYNYQYLISPALPEDANPTELEVSFWAKINSNGNSRIEAGLMTNPSDTSTFVKLFNAADNGSTWTEYTFYTTNAEIEAGQPVYVAFRVYCNNGYSNYIDDIFVNTSSCKRPTNLRVVNMTHESATVAWSGMDDASYQYCIADTNIAAPAEDAELLSGNDTAFTFTDLTPNKNYYVWVRTVCDGAATTWSSRLAFHTPCDPEETPWSESFDSWTTPSSCWNFQKGDWSTTPTLTGNSSWSVTNEYGDYINISGKALAMNIYSDWKYWAISPMIAVNSPVVLSFDLAVAGWSSSQNTFDDDDYFIVALSTDGGNSWTKLYRMGAQATDDTTLSTFTNQYSTIQLPIPEEYLDQTVRLAFIGISEESGGDNRLVIDNIELLSSDCMHPIDIAISCAAEEATFTWNDLSTSNGSGYELVINTVDSLTGDNARTFTTSETHYTVDELTPRTTYYYFLRSACEEEPTAGSWSRGSFRTTCTSIELPYEENFENNIEGNTPDCWDVVSGNSYSGCPKIYNYSSGNHGKVLYFDGSGNTGKMIIASPYIPAALNELEISFDAYISSGSLKVYLATDPANESSYQQIANLTSYNYNWSFREFSSDTLSSLTFTTADTGYLVFVGTNSTNYSGYTYGYIDNLRIAKANPCRRVANVTVSSVTENSATVTWAEVDGAEGYRVLYNIEDDITTATTVTGITGTEAPLTDLQEATTYYVWVYTLCADEGESDSRSASFSTTMLPAALPYSTGFETGDDAAWLFANGTNGWFIGSAASNGGTNGMYISNNNGTANAYTNSTTTTSYAYKLFAFETGEYSFSFDWKANGELSSTGTYYDFLRVLLVPGNAELTANAGVTGGTSIPTGWVDLADRLNNVTDWQHIDTVINIATAGNYQIVFCWRNDGSEGSQTPAAIDNISISLNGGEPPVGIDEVEAADIVLYPNPATSNVTLRGVEAGSQVSVVDMNGRMVRDFKAANDNVRIDVSNLAKGAYFVRVVNGNTNAIRKLIVK